MRPVSSPQSQIFGLRRSAAAALVLLISGLSPAQAPRQAPATPSSAKNPYKQSAAEPLWQKLLRVAGVSATPSTQRGPRDEPKSGVIFAANLDNLTMRPITTEGNFRSPVFAPDDRTVFALRGNKVIRISADTGRLEELFVLDGAYKLIGFDRDDSDELFVVLSGNAQRFSPAVVSLTSGRASAIPFDRDSAANQRILSFLKGSDRVYGNRKLFVASTTKDDVGGTLEWTDVYLRDGDAPSVNLSRCSGVNCGQPSLSVDGRLALFIKEER
jgi:hypothetical protein